MEHSIEEVQNNILNEFSRLSYSFNKISTLFQKLSKSFAESEFFCKDGKIKTSNIMLGKKREKKIKKKSCKSKNVGLGKVYRVKALEKGEEVTAYKLATKYYTFSMNLGPYKNLEFVNVLRYVLQNELHKLQLGKYNFKSIITEFFRQFKAVIYNEYPPLDKIRCDDLSQL